MMGRWTVPKSRDQVEFFDSCASDPNSNSFGRYTEVCPATTMKKGKRKEFQITCSAQHCAIHAYSPTTNRLFAYDNKWGLAAMSHILWECSPPAPNTQDLEMPDKISNKITSTDLETQRAVVQHVLELLDRQKPETSSRSRGNG
ncbi:hypothetical protein MTO96_026131 [Rhipicephalus appendiculatus]